MSDDHTCLARLISKYKKFFKNLQCRFVVFGIFIYSTVLIFFTCLPRCRRFIFENGLKEVTAANLPNTTELYRVSLFNVDEAISTSLNRDSQFAPAAVLLFLPDPPVPCCGAKSKYFGSQAAVGGIWIHCNTAESLIFTGFRFHLLT